jgi:aspartyl/asparaginyl-tRNA synthetase
VYEVGPVFRAEPHDTARHLAEYVSLDAEMGFIDDYTDVMTVLRSTLAGMVGAVAALDVQTPEVPDEIPTIDFTSDDQDPGPLAGYLDAFRYGMPPHGGFAIGLERWVARLVGAANVREVTLFPRDLNRLSP